MSPDPKPTIKPDLSPDAPGLQQQDWEEIERVGLVPKNQLESDIPYEEEPDGELPGEDDDNAYQESDEALPDDAEERSISRSPSREGGTFDEN